MAERTFLHTDVMFDEPINPYQYTTKLQRFFLKGHMIALLFLVVTVILTAFHDFVLYPEIGEENLREQNRASTNTLIVELAELKMLTDFKNIVC